MLSKQPHHPMSMKKLQLFTLREINCQAIGGSGIICVQLGGNS